MVQHIRERLIVQANLSFVGRKQEIAHLHLLLVEQKIPVIFLYGICGIGKTSLLEAYHGHVREDGTAVVSLDCRTIDPAVEAFLDEVRSAVGGDSTRLDEIGLRMGALAQRVILTFDNYEALRELDSWIRQVFLPY